MPDIEAQQPEVITSLWNLPCKQCRTHTTRFNCKLNARLCSPKCEVKFLANPKKGDRSQSRDFVTSADEVDQMEHPGKKDREGKPSKRPLVEPGNAESDWGVNTTKSIFEE